MRKGVPYFKVLSVLLLLVLLLPQVVSEEIFAPFVSGLSAEARDNRILLSWRPAPTEIDSYVIYRSRLPIESDTFHKAVEAGTVEGSRSSFIDTPPDTTGYYYGVLGKSAGGSLYKLFIPYRNVMIDSISVTTTLSPEKTATRITGISASVSGDSIELRFASSKPGRQIIIFRSSRPILVEDDILAASAVSTLSSGDQSFTDTPPHGGIPYYYALFDADMAKSGSYPITVGENALSDPVRIPVTQSLIAHEKPRIRLTPLPYLLLSSTVLSGQEIGRSFNFTSKPEPLSGETLDTWRRIEEKDLQTADPEQVQAVLLRTEAAEELRGEQEILASIVASPFSSRDSATVDWTGVERDITRFMNVRRSAEVKDRAEFYLGQSYFFQGKYQKAFFTFLTARDSLYSEVQPWIERLYPYLRQQPPHS